jgi:hypothetical protein
MNVCTSSKKTYYGGCDTDPINESVSILDVSEGGGINIQEDKKCGHT